jgi:hypothetical protein
MSTILPATLQKNWERLPGNATSVASRLMKGVEKLKENVRASAHSSNVLRNSTFEINPTNKRVKGKSTGKTYHGPWEYITRNNQDPRMRHYLYSQEELKSMNLPSSLKLKMILTNSDEEALEKIKELKDKLESKRDTLSVHEITTEETKIKELITQLTDRLSKRKPAALFYDSVTNRIYDASIIDNGASLCTELNDGGFFPEGTVCKKNEEEIIPTTPQLIQNGNTRNSIPKNTPPIAPAAGGKRKTRRMKRSLKKTKRRNK